MTTLIFAMPGSGKTTLVKRLNQGLDSHSRPAIDFDYSGTRFDMNNPDHQDIAVFQTKTLNAFAKAGVKLITTFPNMIRPDFLDFKLFEIFFILPEVASDGTPVSYDLVDRVMNRTPGDDWFKESYAENFTRYVKGWYKDYEDFRLMAEHRGLNNVTLLPLTSNRYLSDYFEHIFKGERL